ncbi:nuclear transport factor 2 family protein [Kribbella sp. NPDC050459]|uniref:YybH family protein n=1 Tax=Kribbella sp. NPDC050459 TaxID=3155785 RepID=UPI0033D4F1E9
MTDEQAIRTLIETWVAAVHAGDLDTVLAQHAPDLVMFDVPPPYDGVRGLDAYRDTWPGFFEWQKSGASFELESLDVTAGADVAFAFALLHCRNADDDPRQLLRLTIGLRKIDGQWTVTHEHHSFPHDDSAAPAITEVLDRWSADTTAGNLDALMEPLAENVVSYEIDGNYTGKQAVREVCAAGLASSPDPITFTVPDPTIESADNLAVAWSVDHVTADGTETTSRATRVFRRTATGWQLIHQHLSYPAS